MAPARPGPSTRNARSKREFVSPELRFLPSLNSRSAEFAEMLGSFLSSKDPPMNTLMNGPDHVRVRKTVRASHAFVLPKWQQPNTFAGVARTQQEQPWTDTVATVGPHDRMAYAERQVPHHTSMVVLNRDADFTSGNE